jgi:hypothetical protein
MPTPTPMEPMNPALDDWRPTPFSSVSARYIFGLMHRRAGTMRIGPLLQATQLAPDALVEAVNELAERRWIVIAFRNPRRHLPPGLPENFRDIDRITITSFGRWRYTVTWP